MNFGHVNVNTKIKDQLGIKYDWHEPNWNTIKSSLMSKEGIKKNFPKYYSLIEDAMREYQRRESRSSTSFGSDSDIKHIVGPSGSTPLPEKFNYWGQ